MLDGDEYWAPAEGHVADTGAQLTEAENVPLGDRPLTRTHPCRHRDEGQDRNPNVEQRLEGFQERQLTRNQQQNPGRRSTHVPDDLVTKDAQTSEQRGRR